MKFYKCAHCGNLVGMIHDAGVPIQCCGETMAQLTANTTEAAHEKHIPVVSIEGNDVVVTIGSVAHPMMEEHYIEWIYVQTANGGQRKALKPGSEPRASFTLKDDKVTAVYAYCNLHGLWKTEV